MFSLSRKTVTKFLIVGTLLASFNSFGQAFVGTKYFGIGQSYSINNDGTLLITDVFGNFYSNVLFDYTAPADITEVGGNFFIKEDKRKLYSIDAAGIWYPWDMDNIYFRIDDVGPIGNIKTVGGNYFVTKNALFTLNHQGTLGLYNRDELKNGVFKLDIKKETIVTVGGTFFMTKENRLFTIDYKGNIARIEDTLGLTNETIQSVGNNYIIDKEGNLYTIGFFKNIAEDGSVSYASSLFKKTNIGIVAADKIVARGGNFILIKIEDEKNPGTFIESIITTSLNGNANYRGVLIFPVGNEGAVIDLAGQPINATGMNYFTVGDKNTLITVDYNGWPLLKNNLSSLMGVTSFNL